MLPYATIYGEMLVQLLRGGPGSSLKEVAQAAGRQLGVDVAAMVRADGQRIGIGSDPMTACMCVVNNRTANFDELINKVLYSL